MRVRVRDFNFSGTKILRTEGRLKINLGRKRGCSYAAVYNRCISQIYAALFLKPLHKKTYVKQLFNFFLFRATVLNRCKTAAIRNLLQRFTNRC